MIPPEKVLEDNLMCPVCFDFMTNPTTTICGHNFCYDCIVRSNLDCAVCRKKLTKDQVTLNFQLKELIFSYKIFKIELEKQRNQMQRQLEERVVPVYFNTNNLFNNKKLSCTSELTYNNPLVLKDRGNKVKRSNYTWQKEFSSNNDFGQVINSSASNCNIPYYSNQENIYSRIDVMMDDFELIKQNYPNQNFLCNINSSANQVKNNIYDQSLNINYLNNNRKRFKYN